MPDIASKNADRAVGSQAMTPDHHINALRAENTGLCAELEGLRAEVERLTALKTPASRELLNITKGCLDSAEAEVEQLRAALQPFAYEYAILMQQQDGWPTWHSVKTQNLLDAHRALEPKP